MNEPASSLLARHHATMVPMSTTPESPRNKWPQRPFRLDDQTWHAAKVKLATDRESWQRLMETLAWAWIAGLIDPDAVREQLKVSPDASLWHNLLPEPEKE
jgi:hypothetical protein